MPWLLKSLMLSNILKSFKPHVNVLLKQLCPKLRVFCLVGFISIQGRNFLLHLVSVFQVSLHFMANWSTNSLLLTPLASWMVCFGGLSAHTHWYRFIYKGFIEAAPFVFEFGSSEEALCLSLVSGRPKEQWLVSIWNLQTGVLC